MSKIEVDPKLFIKCRLCLDETGHYQIAPNVQMQIKYCFDIDVEPFDGLPQLVCKKCESILSQYAGIKQIFQEKQKNLKSKLSSNVQIYNIIQQQQDTVSSTQADTENKNKIDELTKYNRKTPVPTRPSSTETVVSNLSQSQRQKRKTILGNKTNKAWASSYTKYLVCRYCAEAFKDKKGINNHIRKRCKLYTKYSKMSKACLVSLNKIGSKPNLTGTLDNVVCDENKIIQSREATYYILYTNKPSDQCDSPDSSDEDFIFDKKKRKRQRLISRSSNETVVVDHNTGKKSDDEKLAKAKKPKKNKNTQIDSDIECLDIEDSDSNSTKSSVKTKDFESETPYYEQAKTINDKMIHNIIAMCSNKYIDRLNTSDGGFASKGREESSLKHKILSIGRKVIYSKGINTIGLLRYMEHKNLDVIWVPKMDTKVTIKARSRESGDSYKSLGWENITSVPNHTYISEDFADVYKKRSEIAGCINENIEDNQVLQVTEQCQGNTKEICQERSAVMNLMKEFEEQSGSDSSFNKPITVNVPTYVDTSEKKVNDNYSYLRAVLDADRNWTKLLNANPVANPKQLPKKNNFNEPASIVKIYSNEPKNDVEMTEHSNTENGNEMLHMPIITSTVSLAPPVNIEQPNIVCSNQNDNEMNSVSSTPQSTLPKIKVKPVSELMSDEALSQQNKSSIVGTTGWAVNNENQCQNVLQPNDTHIVYLASPLLNNVITVQPDFVYYTQRQDFEGLYPTVSQSGFNQAPQKKEYVKLHTVELPNTRTDSPIRYFQKLLQMHNILLLDSVHAISNSMNCLMKFKVVFSQDSNSPVLLSLLFFCENNIFCIKANDYLMKEIDLTKFSANWQWEILKVFKGEDVVPKLLERATKFGNPIYNYVNYFTNLLGSIVFTKES